MSFIIGLWKEVYGPAKLFIFINPPPSPTSGVENVPPVCAHSDEFTIWFQLIVPELLASTGNGPQLEEEREWLPAVVWVALSQWGN